MVVKATSKVLYQDPQSSVIIDVINKKGSKRVNSTFQPPVPPPPPIIFQTWYLHTLKIGLSLPCMKQPVLEVHAASSRVGRGSNTIVSIVKRDELRLEHDVAENLDAGTCTRLNGPEAVCGHQVSTLQGPQT